MVVRAFIVIFALSALSLELKAQTKADSLFLVVGKNAASFRSVSTLDPNRAAMLSAVLPGLGQIYNGQMWKVPLIYAGGIIIGHYINYNHRIYSEFKNTHIAVVDNDPTTINPYEGRFGETQLIRNRDTFRENRDYLIIIAAGFYLLNIVDAHVSAHLHEFEVNENLSWKIKPSIQPTHLFSQAVGVSVCLNLR